MPKEFRRLGQRYGDTHSREDHPVGGTPQAPVCDRALRQWLESLQQHCCATALQQVCRQRRLRKPCCEESTQEWTNWKKQKKDLGGRKKTAKFHYEKKIKTNYYASTVKNKAPNVTTMQSGVHATLLTMYSTNAEPRHNASPEGEGVEASPQPPPQLCFFQSGPKSLCHCITARHAEGLVGEVLTHEDTTPNETFDEEVYEDRTSLPPDR